MMLSPEVRTSKLRNSNCILDCQGNRHSVSGVGRLPVEAAMSSRAGGVPTAGGKTA
jgi:hypothetical protein